MKRNQFVMTAAALAAFSGFGMLADEAADEAARKVLAQMTLEEKVKLLGGSASRTSGRCPTTRRRCGRR